MGVVLSFPASARVENRLSAMEWTQLRGLFAQTPFEMHYEQFPKGGPYHIYIYSCGWIAPSFEMQKQDGEWSIIDLRRSNPTAICKCNQPEDLVRCLLKQA